MSIINFRQYIENKKIIHNDLINDYNNGLKFYIENQNNYDIISYNETRKYLLFNIGILASDNDKNFYYEHTFDRTGCYISNIEFINKNYNIKLKLDYYIGGIRYDFNEIDYFLFVSAMYHEFKLRITFLDKPNNDYEFEIRYKNHIMDSDLRNELRLKNVKLDNFMYSYGMCIKK